MQYNIRGWRVRGQSVHRDPGIAKTGGTTMATDCGDEIRILQWGIDSQLGAEYRDSASSRRIQAGNFLGKKDDQQLIFCMVYFPFSWIVCVLRRKEE